MAMGTPLLLMLSALCTATVVVAEEPRVAQQPAASHIRNATERPQSREAAARSRHDTAAAPASTQPDPAPALDLALGNALAYFDPDELEQPLDEGLEEIIVNGRRLEPLRDRRAVPMGELPSLVYAVKNPFDAWRILAPVPNFKIPERNIDDPRDPPGSYRGRILEPGAIYD